MTNLARDEHLQTLRLMAWERAKGELRSIGHAAYTAGDKSREAAMQKYLQLLKAFIRTVEDEGLIES